MFLVSLVAKMNFLNSYQIWLLLAFCFAICALLHTVTADEDANLSRSFTDGKETITLYSRASRLRRDTGTFGSGSSSARCITSGTSDSLAHLVNAEGMEYVRSLCQAKKRRRKRANFGLYPGTNYCGKGHRASSYDDLGQHRKTDACCRDHDYCRPEIGAFKWRGWTFNPMPYTMKSCDCDRRFKDCLTQANTAVAHTIRFTFFYALGTRCFNA